jgi:hypothetical protein
MPTEPLDYESPATRQMAPPSRAGWWVGFIFKWLLIVGILSAVGIAVAIMLLIHHVDALEPLGG